MVQARENVEPSKEAMVEGFVEELQDLYGKVVTEGDINLKSVAAFVQQKAREAQHRNDVLKLLWHSLTRVDLLTVQNVLDGKNNETTIVKVKEALFLEQLKKSIATMRSVMTPVTRLLVTNAYGTDLGIVLWSDMKGNIEDVKQRKDREEGHVRQWQQQLLRLRLRLRHQVQQMLPCKATMLSPSLRGQC